mgnify:CR=1 FL=1
MENQVIPAFVNLGALGLMLWWLTLKLIPQLQRERGEAISAFREEMHLERESHRVEMERAIAHCQEEIKLITSRGVP